MKAQIIIEVTGGVACVTATTVPLNVHLIDWDGAAVGEAPYLGPEYVPAMGATKFKAMLAKRTKKKTS